MKLSRWLYTLKDWVYTHTKSANNLTVYRSVVIFVMLCTSLNLSNYKFAKFGCDEESMNGPGKYLKLALSFLLNHLITRNPLKLLWILLKGIHF